MYLYRIRNLVTPRELDYYRKYVQRFVWNSYQINDDGVVVAGPVDGDDRQYSLKVLPRKSSPAIDIAKRYDINPSYVAFIMSKPKSAVGVHTDNRLRQVNLSFPLDFYSRKISYYSDIHSDEPIEQHIYSSSVLINAKQPHSAEYTGNKTSFMLQISTNMGWDEMVDHLRERDLIL